VCGCVVYVYGLYVWSVCEGGCTQDESDSRGEAAKDLKGMDRSEEQRSEEQRSEEQRSEELKCMERSEEERCLVDDKLKDDAVVAALGREDLVVEGVYNQSVVMEGPSLPLPVERDLLRMDDKIHPPPLHG